MLSVMVYSGAKLWLLDGEIKAQQSLHKELLRHKPESSPENPLARLREQNADIAGWITVPYTGIDYPFVQAKDNDHYLRRDLNGEYAKPGTVFMDYRCARNGSGYSILYGHNMKSGAMFGTLNRFEEKAFFDTHPEGQILFEDGWHSLLFFAFLIVRENDDVIYSVPQNPDFPNSIAARALHFREIGLTTTDRIAALSTCSYAFQDARMVLLGKVI